MPISNSLRPIKTQTSDERRQTNSLSESLEFAIGNGDFDLCRSLVDAGANVRQPFRDCKGCSPVLLALLRNQGQIARYLVDEGATTLGEICNHLVPTNPETPSLLGYTAVHLVCRKDPSGLLPLLLAEDRKAGFPAFLAPVSPLHVAVACGNHGTVNVLFEQESNLHQGIQTTSETKISQLLRRETVVTSITDMQIEPKRLKWTMGAFQQPPIRRD